MREILFRGKRVDNGEWVHGWVTTQHKKYTGGNLLTKIQSSTFGAGEHYVDTETIGQFTGLTDKNGKKIFEGDIVECENYHGKVKGVIAYHNTYFYLSCISGYSDENLFNCSNYKVVGNVYDNAELLEGGEF